MTASPVEEKEGLSACPWCEPLKMELIGKPKLMAFGNEREAPSVEHWHVLCVACGAEGPKEATPEAARLAWNRRATIPVEREKRLEEALNAALGYMLNAQIDLEMGAPKKTAFATIKGGVALVRAALLSPSLKQGEGEK